MKAIETVYNGYRFRSRLEARWAVFFDEAGIKYQYELEGFELNDGQWYLPDFWLPDIEMWIEIKRWVEYGPNDFTIDIFNKLLNFDQDIICIFGEPYFNKHWSALIRKSGIDLFRPYDDLTSAKITSDILIETFLTKGCTKILLSLIDNMSSDNAVLMMDAFEIAIQKRFDKVGNIPQSQEQLRKQIDKMASKIYG